MGRKQLAWAIGGLAVACGGSASQVGAATIHSFSSTDAVIPTTDDGYDPSVVTIVTAPNVTAPSDGVLLNGGAVGLNRFWNSEWAGFSLSSANGTAIDNATEFATGYLTWTVTAQPGFKLQLSSLDFPSARGGATVVRGYELYAAVNGGAVNFGAVPVKDVDDELATATRTAPLTTSVSLAGGTYQNVDSITFRYYPLTAAVGNTIEFGSMTLSGTVVPASVPEPTTAGLLMAGGLAAMGLRRRRRARTAG